MKGNSVTIQSYPYHVYIFPTRCGGTIITKQWILTLWACNAPVLTVLVGSDTIKDKLKGNHLAVLSFRHRKNTTYGEELYPLMILKLEYPLVFGPTVRSIGIGEMIDIKDGQMATIAGFGATRYDTYSNGLLAINVSITTHETCIKQNRLYSGVLSDNRRQDFCAGSNQLHDVYVDYEMSPCKGDYGGGLVVNGRLVGVAFAGIECKDPAWPGANPGVYVSVPFAMDWLYSHLKEDVDFPDSFYNHNKMLNAKQH